MLSESDVFSFRIILLGRGVSQWVRHTYHQNVLNFPLWSAVAKSVYILPVLCIVWESDVIELFSLHLYS